MSKTIHIFFVAILISFLGGVLGAIFVNVYTVPFLSPSTPLLIEKGTSEKRATATHEALAQMNASIVRVVENTGKKLEHRGYGVFISSDGWILLGQQAIRQQSFSIIDHKNVIYSIDAVVHDPVLPLLYIRVATNNAKSAELFQDSVTTAPLPGFLVKGPGSIQELLITPLGYPYESSTIGVQKPPMLLKRFNYQERYTDTGIPAFSAKGELMGFTTPVGIFPVSTVRRSVLDVFRNNKIERAAIPVEYRDSAWGVLEEGVKKIESGAVLIGSRNAIYRLKGVDGAAVRLFGGDIIVQVNDEVLDRNRNLSEVLLGYHIGDRVSLKVLVKGEKKTFEIILENSNLYK